MAGTLLPNHRPLRSRDVHRAAQADRQLAVELLQRQLFEVAGGGILDKHVVASVCRSGIYSRYGRCRLNPTVASSSNTPFRLVERVSAREHGVAYNAVF